MTHHGPGPAAEKFAGHRELFRTRYPDDRLDGARLGPATRAGRSSW